MRPRRHRQASLLGIVLAALLGCDRVIDCGGGCYPPSGIDLAAFWDGGALRPTDLRICVDGVCRARKVTPAEVEDGGPGRITMVVADPGTTVRDLRIEVRAGSRLLAAARGTDLSFPPLPDLPTDGDCGCPDEVDLVSRDAASGQLVIRTVPA